MQIAYAEHYWQDGRVLNEGRPAVLDGYGLADGVFETVAFRQNRLERWPAHLARLREACSFFALALPYDDDALTAFAKTLLTTADATRDYRLRLTVARRGSGSTVTMTYAPIGPPPASITLVPTEVLRPAGNPSARFKTLAYVDHVHAQRGLAQGGMALLCNQWGRVACAAYANVFVERAGTWVTPSIAEGALPGVVRAELLEAGAIEGAVTLPELSGARVRVTNSLIGVAEGRLSDHSTRITGSTPNPSSATPLRS